MKLATHARTHARILLRQHGFAGRLAYLLSICVLSACAEDGLGVVHDYARRGDRLDAGPGDGGPLGGGAPGAICTRTPDEWLATCDGDEPATCGRGHSIDSPGHSAGRHRCDLGPSRVECGRLGSASEDVRERAALLINDRVADLAALHFSHGYRRTQTVSALLDDAGSELQAVIDANRSFSGCIDRSILVPWVETPICFGTPTPHGRHRAAPVAGPLTAPCLAFDTMCTRGRLDARTHCCTAELAARGTVCEDGGARLCDGSGACVSAASIAPAERVRPSADWIALFPAGIPESFVSTELAETVQVTTAPLGLPVDSVEIRAPMLEIGETTVPFDPDADPGDEVEPDAAPVLLDLGAPDVLAIVPRALTSTSRVTVARTAASSPVNAVSYDGPRVPHALFLRPRGATLGQVYVVRGRIDTLPAVMSDGSTASATRVACGPPGDPFPAPSAAALEVRCDLVGGSAVIVGADVSLAWELPAGPIAAIDLIGGVPFGGRGDYHPGGTFGSGTTPGLCPTTACTLTAGSTTCGGIRLCFGGNPGPCVATTVETCDGADNNCNGAIDERGSAACNDGVGCTRDRCTAGSCRNVAQPFAACVARAGCEIGICTDAHGTSVGSLRFNPLTDAVIPTAPCTNPANPGPCYDTTGPLGVPDGIADFSLPTGCGLALGHGWCTGTFDSCACNGPEMCVPPAVPTPVPATGPLPSSPVGCVTAPLAGPSVSGAFTVYDPCDTDGLACTVERVCCEPPMGGYCRTDAMQTAAARAGRARACAAGTTLAAWERVPGFNTNGGRVYCSSSLPFGISGPRCPTDGNPCTSEGCVPSSGACTAGLVVGEAMPEQIFNYDPLNPTVPSRDCMDDANNGSTCLDEQCVAGFCFADGLANAPDPDATECQILNAPGCGTFTCTDDWPAGPAGVVSDCRPPSGQCYIAAEGRCVSAGAAMPTPLGPDPCMVCDPDRSGGWAYSPNLAAVACDDGNPCTADDRCDGAEFGPPVGFCFGRTAVSAGTTCDDGFDCSSGDTCDGARVCRPADCAEVCESLLCPGA